MNSNATEPGAGQSSAGSERLATGVPGLDAVLKGGVFRGGIYVIQGAPGSGKTILGNQVSHTAAVRGSRVIYVTLLAETHARMMAHMRQMRFFDENLIPDRVSYLGAFRTLEEGGLRALLDLIRQEARASGADVLVLDGLATLGDTAHSPLELKKFVHELQTQAAFTACTMFLLTSGASHSLSLSPEYTMVDGLIELKTRMSGRRAERDLQVHKLRGSDYLGGEHAFRITDAGIVVFPRIEAYLAEPKTPTRADGELLSTGISGLDALMGGGPAQHSVTVVTGPAGVGKTTVGLHFLAAAGKSEAGLLFGLHESPAALERKAAQLGLAFGASGADPHGVELIWQPATEALVDEVCHRLLDAVVRRKVNRLLFDGLDGFKALSMDKGRLQNVLAALCNELRGLGVTTLVTAETKLEGIIPGQPLGGLDLMELSPIAENIVVLRLAALRSEIHRLITVVKARDTGIDLRIHRFDITGRGIVIDSDFSTAETVLRELSLQGRNTHPGTGSSSNGG